jgi:dihydroorotate dehydrogenase (NAD+) catalytic subunit
MQYDFLGKKIRGRFGFPSGVIATNADTARYMISKILQLGFFFGKSTTIEPKLGNPEDLFLLADSGSGWNAVGFSNPGLEETVKEFYELKSCIGNDIALIPQIGESDEEKFAYCASKLDKIADAIELNVSCPHAVEGGIKVSYPDKVYQIVKAVRKATNKPLILKINAQSDFMKLVGRGIEAGISAVSGINTLGSYCPELSNEYGGLSGPGVFETTINTFRLLSNYKIPFIAMGGISGASEMTRLERIIPGSFYAIGTSLAEMDSDEIKKFFHHLEKDLNNGTNYSKSLASYKQAKQYKPFIVKDVIEYSDTLRLIRFYEHLNADIGQFVFLKADNRHSKPFSVANDIGGLELVVRKVGETTSKILELKKNNIVRIRGPYGKKINLPAESITFVGAGCGIAPIHHAASHHSGKKTFVIGAKNKNELVYLDKLRKKGEVIVSTDDGSEGYHSNVADLLEKYLRDNNANIFFNCGPEIAMKKVHDIEKKYSDRIYNLVERMTSCGVGICGKCSIPNGKRACVDGPVFDAVDFTPGLYKRDKYGRKTTW